MASLFRGPGKVSNKQRKGDAKRTFGKFGRAIRAKVMRVEESAYDEDVQLAMQQLKLSKAELNAIISGARGMVDANQAAHASAESLISALVGATGPDDRWSNAAKNLGGVLTSVQQHTDSVWDRIQVLVDQLASFFDEDILAANTMKDEFKQSKYEFDEAETAVNKATNEKRPEKERIRDEKRQRMEQVRVQLLDTVNALEDRKNREMTGVLTEYFEALKQYHEQCHSACSRPLDGGFSSSSVIATTVVSASVGTGSDRGSYVFGSASADPAVATNPFGGQTGTPDSRSTDEYKGVGAVEPAPGFSPVGGSQPSPGGLPPSGLPPPAAYASPVENGYGGNGAVADEPPQSNPFGDDFAVSSDPFAPTGDDPFGAPEGGHEEYAPGQPAEAPAQAQQPPPPAAQTNPFEQF